LEELEEGLALFVGGIFRFDGGLELEMDEFADWEGHFG
jgi:hypothetical protein